MAELYAPVDTETLVVDYLGTVDALDGVGISTELPRDWTAGDRHVRLSRIGGIPADNVGHLDRARIQVEAFGATGEDAFAIAGEALLALRLLPGSAFVYAGAVVTAVDQDLGLASLPDPETDAPRYLFGVVLYVHPTAS
ncbi:MAG: hypothetical protein ACRDYV_02180 [Acidimicrobiia bacterium]